MVGNLKSWDITPVIYLRIIPQQWMPWMEHAVIIEWLIIYNFSSSELHWLALCCANIIINN
jgi:hypothetical protein